MARIRPLFCLFLLVTLAAAQTHSAPHPPAASKSPWHLQTSNTKAGLRGIHAVNSKIAWASGTHGAILRTLDGGRHWRTCAIPPGAAKLDFRAIWAFDARTAWAMSSGPGKLSRLYKTIDGCEHWKLIFTNPDPKGFWDAMVFWNRKEGEILGDPVLSDASGFRITTKGSEIPLSEPPGNNFTSASKHAPPMATRFATFSTWNGGKTWIRTINGFLDTTPGSSAAFAASNTSLVRFEGWGWIGIGGRDGSFIYRGQSATDLPLSDGLAWRKVPVPIAGGTDSSGVFSLAFRDLHHGVAVGGDYTKPNNPSGTAAWSTDGGHHWHAAAKPPHGYRSTVAWDPANHAWITAGTNGSDISYDGGKTWHSLGNGNWNAISLPFIVGPHGRIGRLNPAALPK